MEKRILVVDDNLDFLELMSMALEGHDLLVETAEDGDKAIKMLEIKAYDAILCDVNMPKKNGLEVFAHFLKMNKTVPFYFVTGHAKDTPELAGVADQGATIIEKPLQLKSFVDDLLLALGRKGNA